MKQPKRDVYIVKGREKTHIITSVYGRGHGRGMARSTDYVLYINNVMGGNTLYINKRKAKTFYQSAGLQLPLEGKRFVDLFGSSIKTEEDLVKFKMQKEEETKMTTEKQAQKEIEVQNVDRNVLPSTEPLSDYADSYHQELADVCAA